MHQDDNDNEATIRVTPMMPAMMSDNHNAPPYVLIAGRGRSGTNFLLSLLDHSPSTHARNEPNKLPDSALARLPGGWVVGQAEDALNERWDAAVHTTAMSMGERDHRADAPKKHLHNVARNIGIYRLIDSPKARSVLRTFMPSLRGHEWPVPSILANRAALREALPVLKLNQAPGWFHWILHNRPQARVIHIVRHPGGFLNSWTNRWLNTHDAARVHADNLARLKTIAVGSPVWGERFGDIDAMSVEESELWFWRYTNEVIHEAGKGRDNYLLVNYDELSSQPMDLARRVYLFCGLPWTDAIEQRVRATSKESESIATAWRDKLSDEQIALVMRFLKESPIGQWWSEAELQSMNNKDGTASQPTTGTTPQTSRCASA